MWVAVADSVPEVTIRERFDTWYTSPDWVRSSPWTRAVAFMMIPGTLVMVFFVWVGRAYVGSPLGWMTVFFVMWGWPLIILWLAPALPVLRRARRRGRLTLSRAEAWVQVATWAAMFVAGLTLTDYGDQADSSGSALTVLTGAPSDFFTPLFCVAAVLTVSLPSLQSRISARTDAVEVSSPPSVGPITMLTNSTTASSPVEETRSKDRHGPKECHDPHRYAQREHHPIRWRRRAE